MKRCWKCGETKSESEFYKNRSRSDGLDSCCKKCNNSRKRVRVNRDRYVLGKKVYSKLHLAQIREYVDNVKRKGCSSCGYDRCLSALEFHHVDSDEKITNISAMGSLPRIKAELPKCILLCANCHRELHEQMIDASGLRRATHCDVLQFKLFK